MVCMRFEHTKFQACDLDDSRSVTVTGPLVVDLSLRIANRRLDPVASNRIAGLPPWHFRSLALYRFLPTISQLGVDPLKASAFRFMRSAVIELISISSRFRSSILVSFAAFNTFAAFSVIIVP